MILKTVIVTVNQAFDLQPFYLYKILSKAFFVSGLGFFIINKSLDIWMKKL